MDAGKESLCPFGLGMGEEILRISFLGDLAIVEEDDAIGDVPGKGELMGDDDHGHAVPGKILHDLEDLSDHLGIQGGCRFVEEHDVRIHDQGAGNSHPLLLSAGEGPWHMGHELVHPDLFQGGNGPFLCLLTASPEDLHLGIHAVLEDVHVVEEVELLEDHSHMGTDLVDVRLPIQQILPLEKKRSGIGNLKQIEATQEGRLSTAGRADDGDDIALVDIQGDALEDGKAVIAFSQIADLKQNLVLTHCRFLPIPVSGSSASS